MKVTLFIGSILLFTACSKKNIGLNEEFALKFGQTAHVTSSDDHKLKIEYFDLTEESRCAPGVECIWEGRVAVVLKMNDQVQDTLGLNHADHPALIEYSGNVVRLLGVSYKSDSDFGKKEKSIVQLVIE